MYMHTQQLFIFKAKKEIMNSYTENTIMATKYNHLVLPISSRIKENHH